MTVATLDPRAAAQDNAGLGARRAASVPSGIVSATPAYAARARNAEVWDVEGNRFIDFVAGIAVCSTGHCHPKVIGAVQDQLERFTHTSFQVLPYAPYVALAERLNALAPVAGPAKTIFFNSGAEAVENAVKIARFATGRTGVVAFAGAFHGRTLMTTALTGKAMPYKRGFGTLPGEVWRVPFPIAHYGVSVQDSLNALDALFRTDADPSSIAAIIVEPVQGEGGFHVTPPELLQTLRAICSEHGILLICDEVQTGFARTGKLFAVEHSGIAPDIVTMAKALGGGFPIAAVTGRAELMDSVHGGGLGSTFGGAPISCAAALAVLDVIEEEELIDRANAIGATLRARFEAWAGREDLMPIAHVRGLGAMMAFDLVKARGSDEPDPDAARKLVARAFELGLVVISCGIHGETLRLLMPLTISDEVLLEGLDRLEQALAER
ncbi:4-aminobutyrate--2-oxoglutarate transaminase [Sphingomonas sp. HITSZ_GF]|uniref:4-aminobutyrate--2-oxoglutarate transaminase n=1 Tax=Sphingomonas sp. HITSZ_GF TaxID=3037247 RepID=UPI00240E43F5|nr:4-aminobutyrate--2-oxoglutarate transaminase [Sphingomonas sp. HITSZ_GF]MDG2535927.1 4-aminobutyrate--2-oxoglutarate transaminase [Sphingomonas sp. HITSZ_GF]